MKFGKDNNKVPIHRTNPISKSEMESIIEPVTENLKTIKEILYEINSSMTLLQSTLDLMQTTLDIMQENQEKKLDL